MSLRDIYSNNVQKTSIGASGTTGSMPAARERDPKSIELENNVLILHCKKIWQRLH